MPVLTIDQAVRRNVLYFLESRSYCLVSTPNAFLRIRDGVGTRVWEILSKGHAALENAGLTPDEIAYAESQLARLGLSFEDKPSPVLCDMLKANDNMTPGSLADLERTLMAERERDGLHEMTASILDGQINANRIALQKAQPRRAPSIAMSH